MPPRLEELRNLCLRAAVGLLVAALSGLAVYQVTPARAKLRPPARKIVQAR